MKLLRLVTVFVLLQASVVSQAAEMNEPVSQSNSVQIQVADKTGVMNNLPAANSAEINNRMRTHTIGAKKLIKTIWSKTIGERKLNVRDGIFTVTAQNTELYA